MQKRLLSIVLSLAIVGVALALGYHVPAESALLAPALMVGMLNPNVKGSEVVALSAAVNPVSQGAGTVTTGWVALKDFHMFLAMITAGVLGAAATLDAKIQQAQDSGGTGAKDVTGKAITQLVKATDDNKVAQINVRASDCDVKNGFTHIRLSMTVGTAASLIAGHLLGIGPVMAPASDQDGALVKEIV